MNNNQENYLREIRECMAVALGRQPADLVIMNAQVVDLYNGEIRPANIAVAGSRIAYAGPEIPATGPGTVYIEARGLLAVPGYIEIHSHPDFIYNPASVGQFYLNHGTTTVVGDSYKLYTCLGPDGFIAFNEHFQSTWPGHFYWTARLFPETPSGLEQELYQPEQLVKTLAVEEVTGLGELSRWPEILAGEDSTLSVIAHALNKNMFLDGHTAGAKGVKLAALAAAGITGCHESINVEQARERLQNGLYVALRHSSHRRDLPVLLELYQQEHLDTSRVMFTGDGPSAPFLAREGHPGALARLAITRGISPFSALRAVTINCATFLRRDHYLGGITPGRSADINLIRDWKTMDLPEVVIARGLVVARKGKPTGKTPVLPRIETDFPTWSLKNLPISPGLFAIQVDSDEAKREITWPVIQLTDGIITRQQDLLLPVEKGYLKLPPNDRLTFLALLDPSDKTVTRGVVSGLADRVQGFASSFNCTPDSLVVLGNNPAAMAQAARRVNQLRGGMVLWENDRALFELPLELAGQISLLDFDQLAGKLAHLENLLRERGYRFADFYHSIFFLASDFLPFIRVTNRGLYEVTTQKIIYPATRWEYI